MVKKTRNLWRLFHKGPEDRRWRRFSTLFPYEGVLVRQRILHRAGHRTYLEEVTGVEVT